MNKIYKFYSWFLFKNLFQIKLVIFILNFIKYSLNIISSKLYLMNIIILDIILILFLSIFWIYFSTYNRYIQ
uniref:Uncharacterized protein orf71a n=1 Tax=Chara vulgaris TaxID=55564 RepID=Q1ACN2_CHAVU|nr:hypothetical protein ChvuCp012 [Chara vulgaris]ABA61988.1 hypothetical protein [Chara vulgaris]